MDLDDFYDFSALTPSLFSSEDMEESCRLVWNGE